MSQVKDFPNRDNPVHDDFLYLITAGDTDYSILLNSLLGEMTNTVLIPNYDMVIEDQFHTIRMTFNGNKQVFVPTNADVPYAEGTVIRIRNASANTVTLVPDTIDVTIHTKSGLVIPARGEVKLVYQGDDDWDAVGDLVV